MSNHNRRFIRFSLDIPAYRFSKEGTKNDIAIKQISIGGCLVESETDLDLGEEFRLEMQLPNKNHLPIHGKAVYEDGRKGIGVKFQNISQFEQELIGKIISEILEKDGLPLLVDPFLQPPQFVPREEIQNKITQT